jgi:hypothetical protein
MRINFLILTFLLVNTSLFSQAEQISRVKNTISELTFGLPSTPSRELVTSRFKNFLADPNLIGIKNNLCYFIQFDKNTPVLNKILTANINFYFNEETGLAERCNLSYTFDSFNTSDIETIYYEFVNKLKTSSYSTKIVETDWTILHNTLYFYSTEKMYPKKNNKLPLLKSFASVYCIQNNYSGKDYNLLKIEIYYNNIK